MRTSSILAAGALAATAAAENYLGFNSGSTFTDRSAKFKKDFVAEFKAAQALENAPGDFTAVRLYTNIQAYAQDDPIEAFDAAIETKTKILLGVWASGTDNIDKELTALKKAVTKHGKDLTDLVIGISIGSEDLYRTSVTGVINKSGVGNTPEAILGFINDFKSEFKDTPLASTPVGHVDTWDSWTNSSNDAVKNAVDWIGVNSFPYYENDKGNTIKNAPNLFDRSYENTLAVAGDKPVWVTETGWPSSGPDWDEAVASVENAKYFWDEVGCRQLFGKTSTFWYILRDSNPDNKMQFAITKDLSTKPMFDLTCPTTFETDKQTSSVSSSVPSATSTSGSGSGSGTGNAVESSSAPSGTSGSDSSAASEAAGAESSAVDEPSAGVAVQAFTIATYATLALTAGFFALF
ncbi:glycoside hydrolase superfamily [Plectosphaerella plurivora]|uniref:Glycoside hydrolase superfamily n=1 Tax=Plectosphaerella plurivora TaxID=936078 RepID=A0A9P9A8N7_9PEZI|nr:glycoside hydrolase superfamily [Plectosphaerella plurivora]